MDYKKDVNDLQKGLVDNLSKLTNVLDIHLALVPQETMKDVAPIRSDITKILKSVKKGDVDAINQITKKYANIR